MSGETLFRTGAGMVFQMQLSRTRDAAPLSRDYMFDIERDYFEADRSAEANTAVASASEGSRAGTPDPIPKASKSSAPSVTTLPASGKKPHSTSTPAPEVEGIDK